MNKIAFDRATAREKDADGRLHVSSTNISKANICPYKGSEIPGGDELGLDEDKIYYLLRDPEELEKAAKTFNNLPLLNDHIAVDAYDPHPEAVVGSTGTDAVFEGPYLKNSLVVWDSGAIAQIESDDKKEISCAYRYTADMTPGKYEGKHYDGVMRNIIGNHVALVAAGRAGADVVVSDSQPSWEIEEMGKKYSKRHLAKLAMDADIKGVVELLDLLDGEMKEPAEDEIDLSGATEEQKAAIRKIMSPGAEDEFPEKEDEEEKKDEKAEDEFPEKEKEDEPVDKKAMDTAIADAEKRIETKYSELRSAEAFIRPWVGDLIAQDSAEGTFRAALDYLGVDHKDVHPSALKHVLAAQPKPGAEKSVIAIDASNQAAFYQDFPEAKRLRSK
jgi:hypothetical protein